MTPRKVETKAEFLERNRCPHPLTPEQEERIGRIFAGARRAKKAAS